MPQLKGVIKTPTGEPLGGATITLTSLHNRAGILKGVFSHVTTQNGEYNFPVLPGVYSVRLTHSVQRLSEIGVIRVYEDSADGSLNDFLGATDIDLRPESLKKYEELAQQAQQSAEAAAESEQQAGKHADAAARAKEEVKKLAKGVQQNADAVAEGKQQAENLVSQVENAAKEVKKDAEAAKQAASDAEHVREDIDTALSATLKTANRLSELADEGEEAQQESRDNLGLKSAATMTPQSDIRDRTEGRLATPGAFGFGHIFLPAERIRFNTEDDFLSWARNATPGEYFVDGGSKIISGGVLFNGVVSIRWVEARNNPPEPRYTAKVIIFYGINGDIYYNRYWTASNGYLIGWERLKVGETGIADTLRSIAGRANNYGYPGIGGVVFAAYCINDMDEDGRI
ncbi:prophage tail fiber N-terminal domain-containing protein, partial [Escherichia coli]